MEQVCMVGSRVGGQGKPWIAFCPRSAHCRWVRQGSCTTQWPRHTISILINVYKTFGSLTRPHVDHCPHGQAASCRQDYRGKGRRVQCLRSGPVRGLQLAKGSRLACTAASPVLDSSRQAEACNNTGKPGPDLRAPQCTAASPPANARGRQRNKKETLTHPSAPRCTACEGWCTCGTPGAPRTQ